MLVKYGAGIVDARGSIAGMTASRNKSGAYMRARVKPVNPKSVRQENARAIVTFFAEHWHEDLTEVQRGLWETYAAAVSMKNGLGETINLSGFNHFIRCNCAFRRINPAGIITNAPTTLSLPEKDNQLVCSEEAIVGQTFTFTCDITGWGVGINDKEHIMLYQGQPQLDSRQSYHGPFRYMDVIDATEGAAGTGTYDAVYSFALGQKVWFQARVRMLDGRISTLWQLPSRTIEADP